MQLNAAAPLFAPTRLGAIPLANRIVMAPLTRSRADEMGVPADIAKTYYAERASAGLIITEATQISFEGMGYPRTPGIHDAAQVSAWRAIVDAVHAKGGRIVVQLWHVGRIAHHFNRGRAADVVAPSAVKAAGKMYTDKAGMQDHDMPRALETTEISAIAGQFAAAARRAIDIGFDGVELHSANGYLLHQFLSSNVNRRTDSYGGSIENRTRMPLEVLDAIVAEIGADRAGIRVSPGHTFNDIVEEDVEALYAHYMSELSKRRLAYLHVMRPFANESALDLEKFTKEHYRGDVIMCGGYTRDSAAKLVSEGVASAVAFGRPYIANPDLVERFKTDAEIATPNDATFYSPGPEGYIDYPRRAAAA